MTQMNQTDAPNSASDWLWLAWTALPQRQRTILGRRTAGDTLEDIGVDLGLSRERVRQLQKKATSDIVVAAATHGRELISRVALILGDSPATEMDELVAELPSAPPDAQIVLLDILGVHHPRTWDGELAEWWTRVPEELDRRLRAVVELAPMSHSDLIGAFEQLGLRYSVPVTTLLASENSKLRENNLGWYRPARISRDLAFLYLQLEGAPRTVAQIAAVAGISEHAIRETMRREQAFAQVRPEGTWALVDWHLPGSDNRYSNAEEAVVEVVRDRGPISLTELKREVVLRYPVTGWRINQCLSSAMIGLTPAGLYDLAERGATPIEDTEPRRPSTIKDQGQIVGVQLKVNHDLLRGSGIVVNRWLTWRLGLRLVPSLRSFRLSSGGELTVKRGSSNSQISSLRTAVQPLGLVEGCKIALILNTENDAASIHHVCESSSCPAV